MFHASASLSRSSFGQRDSPAPFFYCSCLNLAALVRSLGGGSGTSTTSYWRLLGDAFCAAEQRPSRPVSSIGGPTKSFETVARVWFLHGRRLAQHIHLARRIAATSFVLLQNRGGILPLNIFRKGGSRGGVKQIAVIGLQAMHPTFHGGGSGQVAAAFVPTPLDSLRDALGGFCEGNDNRPAPRTLSYCNYQLVRVPWIVRY